MKMQFPWIHQSNPKLRSKASNPWPGLPRTRRSPRGAQPQGCADSRSPLPVSICCSHWPARCQRMPEDVLAEVPLNFGRKMLHNWRLRQSLLWSNIYRSLSCYDFEFTGWCVNMYLSGPNYIQLQATQSGRSGAIHTKLSQHWEKMRKVLQRIL